MKNRITKKVVFVVLIAVTCILTAFELDRSYRVLPIAETSYLIVDHDQNPRFEGSLSEADIEKVNHILNRAIQARASLTVVAYKPVLQLIGRDVHLNIREQYVYVAHRRPGSRTWRTLRFGKSEEFQNVEEILRKNKQQHADSAE